MLNKTYPYYLANRPQTAKTMLEVFDKYSGKLATRVAVPDATATEKAIAAAVKAAKPMREYKPWARQTVLQYCAARFAERRDELAEALCIEAGKPIKDAAGEVTRLIETFRIAAEEAVRINGETINLELASRLDGYHGYTRRVPLGPVSFITPFNFPLNLVAHKVAPAIAAGCPFVLKPSEKTPIGALIIGEVLAETDLPKGAFSILTLDGAHAAPLVEDPRFKLLSFTGGQVGWALKARAGHKKVTLELGGNAACIVDADQDGKLDHVVQRLVFGAFYQSGQSCIGVQRIYAHADIYDALKRKLVAATKKLKAGDPKDRSVFLGPMIDEAAAERLHGWILEAKQAGGRILCGGKRHGNMLDATLMEDVPADAKANRMEAFGPFALLAPFRRFDEAIAMVNDSDYGLQAGIFTDSLAHAMRAWNELEQGGVIVNDIPSFRVDNMPYGGVKLSGLGREGVRYAIEDMSETRLMVMRES
ncbi:aldehyde dehydrogenase family protein [Rhodanobacter denitrificans]|uniref:aldehyde dehydrogenase family protein n=1 Tax=Rhodanobacter TaxID=75309 RepID=UPI000261070D|nr:MULTISPECIES: aldehyde dehydrogenase family protein [Rhodanobacter]EIL98402.1 NAD-dependent aldehyde dehydrogenase [Rhodanobacter denitrificans]UJJ58387.1 aldehyde dehydrogenase family protein [Rhodanobacter denitrificans]UJM88801.1 aldehyde dehydrogenase family protein [Rhodanobacter denitrificans]